MRDSSVRNMPVSLRNAWTDIKKENEELKEKLRHLEEDKILAPFMLAAGEALLINLIYNVKRTDWPQWATIAIDAAFGNASAAKYIWFARLDKMHGIKTIYNPE